MILRIDTDSLYRWLFGVLTSVENATVAFDTVFSEFEVISIGAVQRLLPEGPAFSALMKHLL